MYCSVVAVHWALCLRTRIYINIYIYMCIYVYVFMCACVCVYLCVCVCVRLFVYLFVVFVYVNIRKCLFSPHIACVKFPAGGLGLESYICLLYIESE
jgi:hypothetical protein